MPGPAVHIQGYREFRRDLRRLEPETEKELRREFRLIGGRVAVQASLSAQSFARTGAFARSIRPYVTAKGISVGSRLPQAGVLHFGGTIKPRGVPIVISPHPVVSQAVEAQSDRIVEAVGDAIEDAARRTGWNR